MRYILFGDSIGVGSGDFENAGWASQLRLYIDRDKQLKDHTLINLSIAGDTSRGLLTRMESEMRLRMRDMGPEEFTLLIAIGTNDSKDNHADPQQNISPQEFRTNIVKLIDIGQTLAGKVILIGPPPVYEPKTSPYKEEKYYTRHNIDEYNQILIDCAKEKDVQMINILPLWQNFDLKTLFDDGLHPNAKGAKIMYDQIRDFMFMKG